MYYALVEKKIPYNLYFDDERQYHIYLPYVLRESYQGVLFPAGLQTVVKPIVDSVDTTFKPAFIHGKPQSIQVAIRDELLPFTGEPKSTHDHSRRRKPVIKSLSSNPYDDTLGYYVSTRDTIGISLQFSDNPLFNVRGLEHNFVSVLKHNLAFYRLLCNEFNLDHKYRSGNRSYLASVLMELFSGTNQYNTWGKGKTKLQPLVKDCIVPELNKWLKPRDDQLWHYTSILAHESHHREFKVRALKSDLFSSEGEYHNLDRILDVYDSQYEIVLTPQFEDHVTDPFSLQRTANRLALSVLSSHIDSPDIIHDLIKYAVVAGCEEVIAQILSRTIAMNCDSLYIDSTLSGLYGGYSPFHYIYPQRYWIDQWEERLLCEYANLGQALASLYTDLFEGQQLEAIVQETTERVVKN